MISSNLSKIARDLDGYVAKMFKVLGEDIAREIHEEFEVLVYETPQYTGTTAASWTLSFAGRAGGYGASTEADAFAPVDIPLDKSRGPLHKGHENAVRIAMHRNQGAFEALPEAYRYSSMMIRNNAPGAVRAEEGPVRAVNDPAHALERFKGRLEGKVFKTNLGKYLRSL